MSARNSPRKRARCITARPSTARSTAKPRRRTPRRCTRKASSFTRCRCCPRNGTDCRDARAVYAAAMSLIERLLRAIPYIRRPYFERDAARAEALALRAKLAGGLDALAPDVRAFFPDQSHFLLPGDDERQDRQVGEFRPCIKRAV